MCGLHDHRNVETSLADFDQYAHAIEARHHQIKYHGVNSRRVRRHQRGDRRIAAIDHNGLIAAFLQHVVEQPALDRVVVGYQNAGSHGFPRALQLSVSNRGTLADAD